MEAKLLPTYSNFFKPKIQISYQLAESSQAWISIYHVADHLVQRLYLGTKLANSYLSRESAMYWTGRNDMGEGGSSGRYFYTLQTGYYRRLRWMSVLR